MRALSALVLILAAATPAIAQEKAEPRDRAALAACLERAAKGDGKADSCIGIVESACLQAPDSSTTVGMKDCTGREIAAWDERLNEAYRKALAGDLGTLETQRQRPSGELRKLKGADILRDAQRAWIAYRDKKCDAAGLPMEGGTGSGLLSMGCFLQETARQTLWLEDLNRQP